MLGKRTFLCFAADDAFRIPSLRVALEAWGISYGLLSPADQPPHALSAASTQEIRDCEVYLRLCTGATRASPHVALADDVFRELLATDRRHERWQKRKLVNLILDADYKLDQQDRTTLYIETANKTRALWLEQLAVPLGVATLKQRVSRRALVGMGIGAGLTLASSGALATLLIQQQRQRAEAEHVLPNSKNLSGQARWTIPLGTFVDEPMTVYSDLYAVNRCAWPKGHHRG